MTRSVVGLFANQEQAERAISDLEPAGFGGYPNDEAGRSYAEPPNAEVDGTIVPADNRQQTVDEQGNAVSSLTSEHGHQQQVDAPRNQPRGTPDSRTARTTPDEAAANTQDLLPPQGASEYQDAVLPPQNISNDRAEPVPPRQQTRYQPGPLPPDGQPGYQPGPLPPDGQPNAQPQPQPPDESIAVDSPQSAHVPPERVREVEEGGFDAPDHPMLDKDIIAEDSGHAGQPQRPPL